MNNVKSNECAACISLRAPEPSDVDLLYLWENDREQWHTSFATGPLSRHQISEYVDSYGGDIFADGSLRFVIEADGKAVGTVDVFDFDRRARHAFVGVYVSRDARGRGYGAGGLRQVIDMMVRRVAVSSLAALVAVDNVASQALFRSLGFVEAGRLAGWLMCDGRWVDALVYQLAVAADVTT